jgi:hypothetical protein
MVIPLIIPISHPMFFTSLIPDRKTVLFTGDSFRYGTTDVGDVREQESHDTAGENPAGLVSAPG